MPKIGTKTLVTGASGLLGNNLVRTLLEQGVGTRILLRETSDQKAIEGLDVEVVYGDIRDPAAVEKGCRGVESVIHAAALVKIGGQRLETFREINAEGTRNLALAALAQDARFVYVSTSDTISCNDSGELADEDAAFDERHATSYSISKYEGELAVMEAIKQGLSGVIVNPSFMLGPWDWKPSSGEMLSAVGKGLGLFPPRGHGCFVDVRDVTLAILAAESRGKKGQRYLLTGETLSYFDAWCLFAKITGANPPLRELRPVATYLCGQAGDMLGKIRGTEPAVNSAALNAAKCPRRYTTTRAETELGFKSRPLPETVTDAWGWLQELKRSKS